MNFTNVKSITIPVNGTDRDVKSISIGGVTVWSKIVALMSISLSGQTTSLNQGDAFSFGGTVTATYSDGSTADVTANTTFSGYNMSTAGTYTVTASYTENGVTATATYQLTVVAVTTWHTLWEGSKSISWNLRNSAPGSVDVYAASFAAGSDIRITFTMSNRIGTYGRYTVNGTDTTTKPSSPYEISSFALTPSKTVLGVSASHSNNTSTSQRYKRVYLYFNQYNKKFMLTAGTGGSGGNEITSGTIELAVTKIEQYY